MAPKKKAAAAALAVVAEEAVPKADDTEMEAEAEVKNGTEAGKPAVEDPVEESHEDDEENGKEEEEPEPVKKSRGRKPKAAAAEKKKVEAPKRGRKKAIKKTDNKTDEDKEEETKDKKEDVKEKKEEVKEKKEEVKEKKEEAAEKKEEVERPRRGNRAQKINYNESSETKQSRAPKRKLEATEEAPKKGKEPALINNTETDFSNLDFTCSKKSASGKISHFKISCWNVDGLRAWCKKGGHEYINKEDPDILCFQETKCAEDKLPEEILEALKGYEKYWLSGEKDGYAGVSLFSKVKPIKVTYGINNKQHDTEGRCITAEFDKFYVVSVYVPNAGRKLVTLPKRLDWNADFKSYISKLDKLKPVIICGDMNVAHNEIDLANPKTNKKNAGFTQEERDGMTEFLTTGFVDTFRKFYPDQEKAYTFWSYFTKARSKNIGWRLDYFLVSERFCKNLCDNVIRSEVFGSDHCPITLFLHV